MRRKIKVLIVDDSLIFREVLARGIASDEQIEVVATAVDPFDARDKILAFHPDVMTCDINMPKMDGIAFIKKLLPQYPLPVIVISSISDKVFEAMDVGAVDFVAKPDVNKIGEVKRFILDIIEKIKIASKCKVLKKTRETGRIIENRTLYSNADKLIAIGASTGGTEAVTRLLKNIQPNIPGMVIVQHIPPKFSKMFAQRLNEQTKFHVKEAENGDYIEMGKVIVAPGDKHIRIKKQGTKYKIEVFEGEKVNGHCPSVDVLFESIASQCPQNAIGIILTGMGYDGAKGLLTMKRKGSRTIGQDEKSSVVYGMPKAAYEVGAVEVQAALEDIPKVLYTFLKVK